MKRGLILCLVLCCLFTLPAMAVNTTGETQVVDGTGASTVAVTAEATQMTVTVPTILPAVVDAQGNVTVATDAQVINHSYGPVEFNSIQAEALNGWTLVNGSYDFAKDKVGAKNIAVSVDGTYANGGNIDLETLPWVVNGNDNSRGFSYGLQIPAQRNAVTASNLARVIFTVDWCEAKVIEYVDFEVTADNRTWVGYSEDPEWSGELIIPETFEKDGTYYKVTSIGDSAFEFPWSDFYPQERATNIIKVVIPSSVTSIGNRAFYGCCGLTNVIMPDSVLTIGEEAFCHNEKISSIHIPKNIARIGEFAFCGCSSLSGTIDIPGSLTEIEYGTFSQTSSVNNVIIREGVRIIGEEAFYGCGMTTLLMPETMDSIEPDAFHDCINLIDVKIPKGITDINDHVFDNCSSLVSVTFPDGLEWFADYAFVDCSSLKEVVIPEGVTVLNSGTFADCTALSKVVIPNSVRTLYYSFSRCTNLKTAGPIGSGCDIEFGWQTSIPSYAFEDINSLIDVIIPGGVTTIGYNVFSGCTSLTDVAIPESVTFIESNAFDNIPHIIYHGTATGAPWGAQSMN